MISSQQSLDYWLADMQRKGLASTAGNWLEKAIQQKNPALSVGVASSRLLVYDRLDRRLAGLSSSN